MEVDFAAVTDASAAHILDPIDHLHRMWRILHAFNAISNRA
jgi:hypothetical protein